MENSEILDEYSNETKKFGRRLVREEIFKLVFESFSNEENLKTLCEKYLQRQDVLKAKSEIDFLVSCVSGIEENNEEITNTLKTNIKNWDISRIPLVEKSLLYIASYEILKTNIPHEVVVNEAVELAKEYGDIKTHEFINGVLANIISKKNH